MACLLVGGLFCITYNFVYKHHAWEFVFCVEGLSCSRRLVLYNLQFVINTMCGSLGSVLRAGLVVGGLSCSRRLVFYNLHIL